MYKLARLSVEALHNITLRVLEKKDRPASLLSGWMPPVPDIVRGMELPNGNRCPIAHTCPIGCAMGFKYLVVDTGLGVTSKFAQGRHIGGQ